MSFYNLHRKSYGSITTSVLITTGARRVKSAPGSYVTRTRSRKHQNHCVDCLGPLRHARVLLTCKHVFCLECAHALEQGCIIKCSLCHLETTVDSGLQVKNLPEVTTAAYTRKGVVLLKSWTCEEPVYDVKVIEDKRLIYIATGDKESPLKVYDFRGRYKKSMNVPCVRMALDTKRNLLMTISGIATYMTMYKPDGVLVGEFSNPYFRAIIDIAYHPGMDLYLVADAHAMCIYAVNPKTRYIVRTFDVTDVSTVVTRNGQYVNSSVTCSRDPDVDIWTVTNRDKGLVTVYDLDADVVRRYGGKGSGDRQLSTPGRTCIDAAGRVIVCDAGNDRIVRYCLNHVGDHLEWGTIVNVREFKLKRPRAVDISSTGVLVVSCCDNMWDGPFQVAIFKGVV